MAATRSPPAEQKLHNGNAGTGSVREMTYYDVNREVVRQDLVDKNVYSCLSIEEGLE